MEESNHSTECSEPPAERSNSVKPLERVKSPPSDRTSSPETNCAICLGKPQNKSFTDSCLHQFCFTCLLEWSKVKAECPLCKQSFTSIIHTVRSIEDYEQYYLRPNESRVNNIFPWVQEEAPFRYRTTYLGYFVRFDGSVSNGHHIIPPAAPTRSFTSWFSPRRRSVGTSDYRRNIYNHNLWVQRIRDVTGSYRECTPEFFRLNPAQIHRLVPWLNRELTVLVEESMIQSVLSRIMELLTLVHIRSVQFRDALIPFLRIRTDHFIHELYSFASSPFDMIGYDRSVKYVSRGNIAHELDTSTSSSDSDIQIVDEHVSVAVRQNPSPVAGPSGLHHTVEVISDSDEADDCMIVGSVNSQLERTPEIITIDSDDEVRNRSANEVNEVAVFTSDSEGVDEINAGPSCSHKLPPKARMKQYFTGKRKISYDSDESNHSSRVVNLPKRKRMQGKSVSGHPRIIWYSDTSALSSDDELWKREKYKMKRKKMSGKKTTSLRKKHISKESKRSNKTTKHWKKRIYCKKDEDSSSSDDSGPVQIPRRRKSVALNSSPEPENRTLLDHNYPYGLANPYSSNEIKNFVGCRPRLRSVVFKTEHNKNKGPHNSSIEEKSRYKSPGCNSSRTSEDENFSDNDSESNCNRFLLKQSNMEHVQCMR